MGTDSQLALELVLRSNCWEVDLADLVLLGGLQIRPCGHIPISVSLQLDYIVRGVVVSTKGLFPPVWSGEVLRGWCTDQLALDLCMHGNYPGKGAYLLGYLPAEYVSQLQ